MKLRFLVFVLFLVQQGMAQKAPAGRFILHGNVSGADSVILIYRSVTGKFLQPAKAIVNDRFTFEDDITEPVSARLLFKKKEEVVSKYDYWDRTFEIYLEPSTILVSGQADQLKKLVVSGSESQAELEKLNAALLPVELEKQPVLDALKKETDHEKAAAIRDQLEPYNERSKKVIYDFFMAHPNSYVTVNLINIYVSRMGIDSAKKIYANFNTRLQQKNPAVKEFARQIKLIESGLPGRMASDFTTKDIHGKPLSLSAFRGKYVLIDFWADWCVPCRKGNPHLLTLYKTYHPKGLEIIGVADNDSNEAAWKKAVETDRIGVWHHVLRGLNMELAMKNLPNPADISNKYGISSLPTKILIDPEGKIIGRYGDKNGGTDQDLDEKLAAIFK